MNEVTSSILVEMHDTNPPTIKCVLRSYETHRRATEDKELLEEACQDRRYEIVDVLHIDN